MAWGAAPIRAGEGIRVEPADHRAGAHADAAQRLPTGRARGAGSGRTGGHPLGAEGRSLLAEGLHRGGRLQPRADRLHGAPNGDRIGSLALGSVIMQIQLLSFG